MEADAESVLSKSVGHGRSARLVVVVFQCDIIVSGLTEHLASTLKRESCLG